MKLRFLQTCEDKHTHKIYEYNSVHEFDDERGKEILKTRYAVEVKGVATEELAEKAPQEEKPDANDAPQAEEPEETAEIGDLESALDDGAMVNLKDLTINELKKLAKKEGVAVSGTKDEIIERIMAKHENA